MRPGLRTTEKWLVAAWAAAMVHLLHLPLVDWLHALAIVSGTVTVCWYTSSRTRLKVESEPREVARCDCTSRPAAS